MRIAILAFVLALGLPAVARPSRPSNGWPKPLRRRRPAAAEPPPIVDSAKPVEPEPRACAGDTHGLGGERLAFATVAERETIAYDAPGGKPGSRRSGLHNDNGHAMVFGVRRVVLDEDCRIEWYRVWLPDAPQRQRGVRPRRRRSPGAARSHADHRRSV